MSGHVDLPRLKEGKNGGAFWSAFVPCPPADDYSDENYAKCELLLTSSPDSLPLILTYPQP
jgi:membrane dipeptidase